MTDATDRLIDDAYALYRELNDIAPLWSADVEQIERWFSTSTASTASLRARADTMIDRVLGATDDATTTQRVSLLTAAAALRQLSATADVRAEREWASPTLGLLGLLPAAVPSYALVTDEHGQRYREKLRRLPAAIEELCERLVEAAAADRAPLRRHAEQAIATIDRMLGSDVADDPVVGQAAPTDLDPDAAAAFRADLGELVASHVRPALARLRDTLATHSAPAGRDDDHPGLLHLPGGAEEYAAILAGYTTPDATPEQVHATGLAQLERLDDEWAALGQEAFDVDDPAEVRRRLAAVPGRTTAEEVERDATAILRLATERAPQWFNRVPVADCTVTTVEHGAIAYYRPPSDDGSLPGVTHFNVADPTVWGPKLAAATVHEGIPGHHYQIALAREDPDLHDVHRRVMLSSYSEGWALYVERIGDEMGLYPDVVDRLGMLTGDAWRAARMVVDTGLHAMGWTRQQAVDAMVEHAGLGIPDATAEVDRYIAHPGQATSYMTGRLVIERLRDQARDRLGGDFDIAAFHDVVLSQGMVSLDGLEALVEDWVVRTG